MRHVLSVLFTSSLVAAVVPAQARVPSPDAAAVREYVAAFNAGEAVMRAYFETRAATTVPVEQRLERYRSMKEAMGTLTLRRIVSVTGDSVVAEIQDGHGELGTFSFGFEAGKLAGIRVQIGGPGDGPGAAPPQPARDERAAIAAIDEIVERASKADEFSGVVMLARDGRPRWSIAVGDADKALRRANAPDTKFNVGSIGKAFTALAVAQLVAAGKLTVDDPVGRFLPEYPNATVRDKVTIRHLLTMQSGIGDFFGPRYAQADKTRLRTLADYLPLFADEPLHFAPGEKREYSNGGYIVLGLIIETLSGVPYDEYVRSRVFEPAGMRDTGFFPKSEPAVNRALGYTTRLGDGRTDNSETLPERGSSAGGVYSTAADLVRYVEAAGSGTLVPLDVLTRLDRDPRGLGIAGGAPGLNAALESGINGYTLVVLSNYDPPSAERLAREIRSVVESLK